MANINNKVTGDDVRKLALKIALTVRGSVAPAELETFHQDLNVALSRTGGPVDYARVSAWLDEHIAPAATSDYAQAIGKFLIHAAGMKEMDGDRLIWFKMWAIFKVALTLNTVNSAGTSDAFAAGLKDSLKEAAIMAATTCNQVGASSKKLGSGLARSIDDLKTRNIFPAPFVDDLRVVVVRRLQNTRTFPDVIGTNAQNTNHRAAYGRWNHQPTGVIAGHLAQASQPCLGIQELAQPLHLDTTRGAEIAEEVDAFINSMLTGDTRAGYYGWSEDFIRQMNSAAGMNSLRTGFLSTMQDPPRIAPTGPRLMDHQSDYHRGRSQHRGRNSSRESDRGRVSSASSRSVSRSVSRSRSPTRRRDSRSRSPFSRYNRNLDRHDRRDYHDRNDRRGDRRGGFQRGGGRGRAGANQAGMAGSQSMPSMGPTGPQRGGNMYGNGYRGGPGNYDGNGVYRGSGGYSGNNNHAGYPGQGNNGGYNGYGNNGGYNVRGNTSGYNGRGNNNGYNGYGNNSGYTGYGNSTGYGNNSGYGNNGGGYYGGQ